MKKESEYRERLISHQLTLVPFGKINAAEKSWQSFADHLMSIIGEEGFLVLYARSLRLLSATFPMLPNDAAQPSADSWLADLEFALTGHDPSEANCANHQLLMTLTNILASLIGEELTVGILHSAWGDVSTNEDPASEEIKDAK